MLGCRCGLFVSSHTLLLIETYGIDRVERAEGLGKVASVMILNEDTRACICLEGLRCGVTDLNVGGARFMYEIIRSLAVPYMYANEEALTPRTNIQWTNLD